MKAKTGSASMDMMDTAIVKAMVNNKIRLKSRVLIPQAVAVSGSSEVKMNSLYRRRWISSPTTAVTACTRSCSTETKTELPKRMSSMACASALSRSRTTNVRPAGST